MPELPEVETIRRELLPVLLHRRIRDVRIETPHLRFPLPDRLRQTLTGAVIGGAERRGKYLLIDLIERPTLIVHFGMSGSFRILRHPPDQTPPQLKHDHIAVALQPPDDDPAAAATLLYHDPRRFGFMTLADDPRRDVPAIGRLGPDPVADRLSTAQLAQRLADSLTPTSARSVKSLLLDQTVIAGIGNIYASEILHRARIHPLAAAATLLRKRKQGSPLIAVAQAMHEVLQEALQSGGSTLRDHTRPNGQGGYFQHRFCVYDRRRQPCFRHPDRLIERIVQNGRSTFFCPKCQPKPRPRRNAERSPASSRPA